MIMKIPSRKQTSIVLQGGGQHTSWLRGITITCSRLPETQIKYS
jgi:hypothetical protein